MWLFCVYRTWNSWLNRNIPKCFHKTTLRDSWILNYFSENSIYRPEFLCACNRIFPICTALGKGEQYCKWQFIKWMDSWLLQFFRIQCFSWYVSNCMCVLSTSIRNEAIAHWGTTVYTAFVYRSVGCHVSASCETEKKHCGSEHDFCRLVWSPLQPALV